MGRGQKGEDGGTTAKERRRSGKKRRQGRGKGEECKEAGKGVSVRRSKRFMRMYLLHVGGYELGSILILSLMLFESVIQLPNKV